MVFINRHQAGRRRISDHQLWCFFEEIYKRRAKFRRKTYKRPRRLPWNTAKTHSKQNFRKWFSQAVRRRTLDHQFWCFFEGIYERRAKSRRNTDKQPRGLLWNTAKKHLMPKLHKMISTITPQRVIRVCLYRFNIDVIKRQ